LLILKQEMVLLAMAMVMCPTTCSKLTLIYTYMCELLHNPHTGRVKECLTA